MPASSVRHQSFRSQHHLSHWPILAVAVIGPFLSAVV